MYRPRSAFISFSKLMLPIAMVMFVWIAYLLQPILMPFVAAAVLAYILNPVVTWLNRFAIRRAIASMLVMMAAIIGLALFVLMVAPMFINQFQSMINKMPLFINWIAHTAIPRLNELTNSQYNLDTQAFVTFWEDNARVITEALKKISPSLAKTGGNLVMIVTNILLLPFLLYYFLLDWPRWRDGFKKLIPRRAIDESERIMNRLDDVLGEFLRGQLTVMVLMAFIYGIGLSACGLENGFAIGLLAGFLVFIPYLGAFTGLLLATIAAVLQFQSWGGVFLVWVVFACGQTLESFIVTPYLVGERIGLTPLTVIFSLMAFGQLMGFTGMLLALPLAAICVVLFQEGADAYFASRFYRQR